MAGRKLEDQRAVGVFHDHGIAIHPLLVAGAIESRRLVADRALTFATWSPHLSVEAVVRQLSIQVPNDVSDYLHSARSGAVVLTVPGATIGAAAAIRSAEGIASANRLGSMIPLIGRSGAGQSIQAVLARRVGGGLK